MDSADWVIAYASIAEPCKSPAGKAIQQLLAVDSVNKDGAT